MNIKQLRVLVALAECGSFGGAARKLRTSQPAISYQLKMLEEELGETLVLRGLKGAQLSSAGRSVLSTARSVLGELSALEDQFARRNDASPSGTLRVTTSAMGIVYLYGDLLERFLAEYPRIEVVVTAAETPLESARAVATHGADVALGPFPVNLSNVEEIELGETSYLAVVGPGHPLATRTRIALDDLRAYPIVRYEAGAGSRLISDRLFKKPRGYPEIFLESNDTEFVKRIVGLGLATAIVARFTVREEIRNNRLRGLTLVDADVRQKYGLVIRRDERLRAVDAFRDFCSANRALIPA